MTTINGEIDEYGFERADDFDYKTYENFMAQYLSVLSKRLSKWDRMMTDVSDLGRSNKVKRYVRKGIPGGLRAEVWMNTTNAQSNKEQNPGKYQSLLKEPDIEKKALDAINGDIRRTYPENVFFKEIDESLLEPLRRVLTAFACHNKNVGYCQGLNYIAGMLLLITKDEENTFWLLVELIENIVPDFYSSKMTGLRTECKVLDRLISLLHPELHAHFKRHNVDMELLASKWFVCLFADVLPIETMLRLWDCLFYEGSKILLRAALAIILINKDRFLRETDFAKLCNIFKEIINNDDALDCHSFMKQCFKLPRSLSRTKIEKFRSDALQQINADG